MRLPQKRRSQHHDEGSCGDRHLRETIDALENSAIRWAVGPNSTIKGPRTSARHRTRHPLRTHSPLKSSVPKNFPVFCRETS